MDGAPLKVSEGGEVEGGLEDGGVAALRLVEHEQGEELHLRRFGRQRLMTSSLVMKREPPAPPPPSCP